MRYDYQQMEPMDVERFVHVTNVVNDATQSVIKAKKTYGFTDCAVDGDCESRCGSFTFEDKEFTVKRGDYAPLMEKVSYYLQQAQVRAQRDTVRNIVTVQSVYF